MKLCFDATRIGGGLSEAIELAAEKGVPSVEYTFAPFEADGKGGGVEKKERQFLKSLADLCGEKNVEIACLSLDYTHVPGNERSFREFKSMLVKLCEVSAILRCKRLAFWLSPGFKQGETANDRNNIHETNEAIDPEEESGNAARKRAKGDKTAAKAGTKSSSKTGAKEASNKRASNKGSGDKVSSTKGSSSKGSSSTQSGTGKSPTAKNATAKTATAKSTATKTAVSEQIDVASAPPARPDWKELFEKEYAVLMPIFAEYEVKPLLHTSTPMRLRGVSLKHWHAMEPQDWRDLLSSCPELALSFSPGDCLWLGIDYLQILSHIVTGIDHIEGHDAEINRPLLKDSGLFGPLWWRYRQIGKGQVDWGQLIETLKLFDYKGDFSIQLDDEFLAGDELALLSALDDSISKIAPFLT